MGAVGGTSSIDELLDRAVTAINDGDRIAAVVLAEQVLAADEGNPDAEDLLTLPDDVGEIRRLTILFTDVANSTALSADIEPEAYRTVLGRYRDQVCATVHRYEGHLGSTKGEALLAVFGHPTSHENDVRRAVLAGLEIVHAAYELSDYARRKVGGTLDIRVGVHRGVVYLDTKQDDVYGLAANMAARVCGLAPPGAIVVSDAVEALVRNDFDFRPLTPATVKGIDEPIAHYQVLGERVAPRTLPGGPLVGRNRELTRLRKCWARAQSASLTTPGVALRGDAGLGKSRLAAAAVDLVEPAGAAVLELHGSPFHTDVGLHPVRTLIEHRCGITRLTPPRERLQLLTEELRGHTPQPEHLISLLAPVLAIEPQAGYEPARADGRKLYDLIIEAVRDYLMARVGTGPALLVAEDAHWFDPSTIEVLHTMLDAAAGRLLVVITGRTGQWLPDGWPVKIYDLKPLSDDETDELILALDPTADVDERADVRSRCDGVPFYIEEVVRALGAGVSATTGYRRVPDTLYEPLLARLRATPKVVTVVEAAATIGRRVDRDLLNAVCTLSEDDIDDVIDDLEEASVLEPCGVDSWRFRHELLREVAAELAPRTVRQGLHARVADAMVDETTGDPDWPRAANHYGQAERFPEAAQAYRQASAAARRRGALAEARDYMTSALDGIEQCPQGPSRDRSEIAIRLERGLLAAASEFYTSPAVAADFQQCLRLVETGTHDDEVVATMLALVSYCATRADLTRMAKVLHSVRDDATTTHWCYPALASSYGVLTWLRGEFNTATTYFADATADRPHAERHPIEAVWYLPNEPVCSAHLHLGMIRVWRGDAAAADAELNRATECAAGLVFPQSGFMECFTKFMTVLTFMETDRLDHAAVVATEMIGQAEAYGFDQWRLAGMTHQAAVAASGALRSKQRDPEMLAPHIAAMTTLLQTWRAVGLDIYLTFYDAVLAQLHAAAGEPEQAREHLDRTLAQTARTGMRFYDAELLRLRARTQSDPQARQDDIAAALALARDQGAPVFELRSALDDFTLRGAPARAALIDAAGRVAGDPPEKARARTALGRTR
jgi:class 3 adenylate cyclase